MKTTLQVLEELHRDKKDCMLVTITAAYGSTPGRVGAMMIVTGEGRRFGTIGGGAIELKSEELAMQLLEEKRSYLQRFRLHKNEIADIGMICGGENDVDFRFLSGNDDEAYAAVTDALVEKLGKGGKVYLFGAGHISQALAPLLVKLDFACGVYDDREEYLNLDCFDGIETVKIDPTDISEITAAIGEADYICIMTHGHKDDFEIQRQVMKTKARYIGVIGSARKQKTVREKIMALGFAEEDFENVVSPIGLNIGADTPEEIAVCIAAQLIMVRSGRGYGEKDWKR